VEAQAPSQAEKAPAAQKPQTLKDAPLGNAYDSGALPTPSGASGSVAWTVPAGSSLPPGLQLQDNKISGTPTQPQDAAYQFSLAYSDSASPPHKGTQGFSLLVKGGSTSNIDTTAFELITGVGAVLAGANYTSYNVNNDVLTAANIGRKTPEILAGGAFILPWKAGRRWITSSYCDQEPRTPTDQSASDSDAKKPAKKKLTPSTASSNCAPPYNDYRPWEVFLSLRFAPGTDQALNGFTVGGGYKITKYLSLLIGYSVTPVNEPSPGFRIAAADTVQKYPTIAPYNQYNPSALLNNTPGAFDGFPTLLYNATGPTGTHIFLGNPTVTHFRSGIFFGLGVPVNLGKLFGSGPSAGQSSTGTSKP
jgi:hypothetical protein